MKDKPLKNLPPPWQSPEDRNWGDICDANGLPVADCNVQGYLTNTVIENREFILKACNLHAELAALVVELAARWKNDGITDAPELGARLRSAFEKL